MPVFTIFTPSYNRQGHLRDIYHCLLSQTFTDFEWLIVDDGSTDGTQQCVASLMSERKLQIRYFPKENGGPHTAHNVAVDYARGKLFLRLDSDDQCVPEALERLYFHWNSIPEKHKSEFSGVSCLCMNEQGEVVGDRYLPDRLVADFHAVARLKGEKWGFHRTEVLREYPFPTFAGERFVPEALIWNRLFQTYKTLCINEALRIYRDSPDSMTRKLAKVRYASPQGTLLYYSELLAHRLPKALAARAAANYVRFSIGAGKGLRATLSDARHKTWVLLMFPVGAVVFAHDYARGFCR